MPNVRYEYDTWVRDGYLFIRVEAVEWERASVESLQLGARRYAQRYLLGHGVKVPRSSHAKPLIELHDEALDWATDMPVAHVYRTCLPLLEGVNDEALAAQ